jgi:hypothetical protein
MDSESLRLLSERGFEGVPGDQLYHLGVWCSEFSEASGDARYSTIGSTLIDLAEWWSEHDEYGGIPPALKNELESLLTSQLPTILGLENASEAAPLARLLREEVQSRLTGVNDWIAAGYVMNTEQRDP